MICLCFCIYLSFSSCKISHYCLRRWLSHMVIFINKNFHQQKLWTFLEVLQFLDHSEESFFPVTCDYFNCIIINYPEDELLVESYLGLSFSILFNHPQGFTLKVKHFSVHYWKIFRDQETLEYSTLNRVSLSHLLPSKFGDSIQKGEVENLQV